MKNEAGKTAKADALRLSGSSGQRAGACPPLLPKKKRFHLRMERAADKFSGNVLLSEMRGGSRMTIKHCLAEKRVTAILH